jgi:hypothetical protein
MMSELQQESPEIQSEASAPRRTNPLRRIGCILALVFWFALLLLPCFLIILATQNEIVISQGSLPNQEIRVMLIMEVEERGVMLSSTSTQSDAENNAICLQTNVSYLLWQGSAEPSAYCECYQQRQDSSYTPIELYAGNCTIE